MNTQETIGAVGALSNLARSFTGSSPASLGGDITEGAAGPSLGVKTASSSGAVGGYQGVTNSAIRQGDWNVSTDSGDSGFSLKYIALAAIAGAALWLIKTK